MKAATLCLFMVCASSVYGQTRAIDKACSDVPQETKKAIAERAAASAKDGAPLGRVSKEVREWVKLSHPIVPDGCAVELVRDAIALRDEAFAKRIEQEKKEAFDKLSDQAKRWVEYQKDNPNAVFACGDYSLGQMGKLATDMMVIEIIGPQEAIVSFGCDKPRRDVTQPVYTGSVTSGSFRNGEAPVGSVIGRGPSFRAPETCNRTHEQVLITGIDTAGLVTGRRNKSPEGPFEIIRTQPFSGGASVFVMTAVR